jgi:hypothetical protein
MTEVTLTDPAALILSALRDALADATSNDNPLFETIDLGPADEPPFDRHLHGPGPVALLLWAGQDVLDGPLSTRVGLLDCQLLIAVRQDAAGLSSAQTLLELAQIRQTAMDAIEAAPLPSAGPWIAGGKRIGPLRWGSMKEDPRPGDPWMACRTELQVAWRIDPSGS